MTTKMKKIVKYLVAAFAMVAAVSCQENLVLNEKPVQDSGKPAFSASLSNLKTRTVLDEEAMKSYWQGNEEINIMDFEGINNKYTAYSEDAVEKITFNFAEGADFYGNSVFAVYPYNDDNEYWSDLDVYGIVANHWTTQYAKAGTYDPCGAVHVAYNDDFATNSNLVFNNLSALIKFTVTDPGVKNITITGLNGEVLSGPVKYRYENGTYVIEDKTAGYDYVELYAPAGEYLEVGKSYYIAVVPGTFEKGISVELNKNLENKITYKHEGKVVLNSNTINNFGAFETMGDLSWGLVGAFNNWGGSSDVLFEKKDGMFVIENYTFKGDTEFKIRANNEWNDDANYGLTFPDVINENGVYTLANGGWTHNAYVIGGGTYDIWFDPFGMKLYVMEPGTEPSEAEVIPPVRYVVGSFNGWQGKDYELVMDEETGLFTTFVEFSDDLGYYEFKINVGDNWLLNWGISSEPAYVYESGKSFKTTVNADNISVANPGFYMIQQSYDGFDMVITDVETPKGKQILLEEMDLVFDLGCFEEDMLYIGMLDEEDPTVAWMFEENLMAYPFEIIPTGTNTGIIRYDSSMTVRPNYVDIAYGIDGSSIKLYCEELGFEGTEVELLSEEDALSIELFVPAEAPSVDGFQWRATYDDEDYLIDLGYTFPGKMAVAKLGEDKVWHFLADVQAYEWFDVSGCQFVVSADEEIEFCFEVIGEKIAITANVLCESLFGEDYVLFTNVTEEVKEPFFTPDGKQWIIAADSAPAQMMGGVRMILDLGVHSLISGAKQLSMGMSYADMGCPSYKDMGLTLDMLGLTEADEDSLSEIFVRINSISYLLVPTDDVSGCIYQILVDEMGDIVSEPKLFMSYKDFDGNSADFDFSVMFMSDEPMYAAGDKSEKYHYIIPQ